ncbi:alanine--tRNA ligase [Xiamenia xianingshaonis]|uniref:Alanine--tRNA ligase n=1 Tax=Xiamenia xianingshaonis TaxID=2682776 RepID=A0A9E6SU59_9ACTN|nr:alanine--tRNA ligase [Xiamenia xianingshaonis]NHM14066.1 alanine--tRNA ligase [Xiamenia xianingshaonis]QTU83932.1 alanine--tRNA ligase [Xiamenia xianingshaonis]
MQYMTTAEIREKYLSFFEEKGCKRMPSSSLIPDDPSLLLTSAGMVQFKPYFLQQKHLEAPYIGTTTVQKCVRTNDIDIIGTTGRHLSFFEMLGNFSFGEYFKEEMCAWAYEFSTEVLGLPAERLYFTVFEDDDETIEIWKALGVPENHISKLGEDDNFWRAGPTGPCGPCSEIYFDQGEEFGCGSPDCAPGCDCDRFLEYWNCVFTQYDGQEDGTLAPLPKKNIDTGMGLERIAAIMQGVQSNYETDVLRSLVSVGERLTGTVYGDDGATDLSLRIMADHSRAVTFMIADGILPSNEGRGYVLRRLLRRAVMKGHLLGLDKPFLNEYVDEIVRLMGHVYPEIVENRELARRVILSEEERFGANLRQGRAFLDEALAQLEGTVLPGEQAFILHDTYGFPVEITSELADERGIQVDLDGFEVCMNEQRERARAANTKDAEAAWSTYGGVMSDVLDATGPTEFLGYENVEADARIVALVRDGELVDALEAGDEGRIVLTRTPFYAEKGGQVGDIGCLETPDAAARVTDTQEPEKGLIAHTVVVENGRFVTGQDVHATIDAARRARICRNHTATHILHWALRKVLGDHVKQAGSLVAPNRLRFDFTHYEAVAPEQIREVECLANEKIMENHLVTYYETSLDEARKKGVMALFGEKYGEIVRVLDIEGFSTELCGGTHVGATSEIGFVKITTETSVGANLRRIEAVTSFDALAYANSIEAELKETASSLGVPMFDVSERAAANVRQLKDLNAKMKFNRETMAANDLAKLFDYVAESKQGYRVLIAEVDGFDAGQLRNGWDLARARVEHLGAVVFASVKDDRPILLAAGTPEAVEAGFDAGSVIKAIAPAVKGGGGGKPTMAQAGGKDASGVKAALQTARDMLL